MIFIPVVLQWYDSDKCSDDQYCPPHMVTVSHHSCCHWDGETLTADHSAPSPLRVSCYAHRPKTVTTSFQRGFPLRRWTESPHWSLPPPSLPISAPLQKCAIFLWRVFELTATGRCWCSARWCLAAFCWSPLLRWQLLSAQLREMPADDRSQGWVSDHQSSADQSLQLIHSIAACSHCSHTSYSWQPWLPVGQNVTNWCSLVVST